MDQRLKFKNLKKGGCFPATVDRGENGFRDFLADDQIFDGRRGGNKVMTTAELLCFYIASLISHDNSFGLWSHFTEEVEGQRDEVVHP